MKSILKATAVLGSASVASILAGLISAKVAAVTVGPGGLGYMGLLQSLAGLTMLIAGMGIGQGLVREGAKALAQEDSRREAALRRGAWLLIGCLGGLAVAVLIVVRAPLSRIMLGGAEHEGAVVAMAFAVLLGLAAGLQTSILNAHRRVGDLARVGLLSSLIGVALTVLFIWRWREQGIVPALVAGFAVLWAVSFYYMRARLPAARHDLKRGEVIAAARELLSFGAPFTASMLVGAGVPMIIPAMVLLQLGSAEVGFYRAAAAISVNYLGVLIAAMAQDYYPRVSAAHDQPELLVQLINNQLRLVLLLGGPVILGTLALVPFLVPLVYSTQFAPAGELLEWQLIGDLVKFSGWTMSFVILARMSGRAFFCTELFGGSLLLLSCWLGMRWFGLVGLGLAFTITAIASGVLGWLVLRRNLRLRWTMQNKLLFVTFAFAMIVVRALPHVGLIDIRTPVALALAMLLGALSLYLIWGEVGGWQGLLAWRRREAERRQGSQPG